MERRTGSPLLHYAQGMLMGTADVIPGVSGGTVALILGIYKRLIDSLSALFSGLAAALRGRRAKAGERFREVEWRLAIPLLLGIGTAIVIGSKVIPPLMERYPAESRGLFFGLVAASIAVPWMGIDSRGVREILLILVSAALAFVLVGLPPSESSDPSMARVFGSAAVAICAMILPGVSGAFLLSVLGMYTPTLAALSALNVPYILVFIAGAATGLAVFSKILQFFLNRWHDLTMAALVGLMAGSLRALWPWQGEAREVLLPGPADPVASVLLLTLLGFALVSALTWWGARQLHREMQEMEEG